MPILTAHAVERWAERVCNEQRGWAPWDLPDEFERSPPVGIPGPGRGRLHAPTDSVLVYTRDWSLGPPVVVTVLYADPIELADDHLKVCDECGLRYEDRGDERCPWSHDPTTRRNKALEACSYKRRMALDTPQPG